MTWLLVGIWLAVSIIMVEYSVTERDAQKWKYPGITYVISVVTVVPYFIYRIIRRLFQ